MINVVLILLLSLVTAKQGPSLNQSTAEVDVPRSGLANKEFEGTSKKDGVSAITPLTATSGVVPNQPITEKTDGIPEKGKAEKTKEKEKEIPIIPAPNNLPEESPNLKTLSVPEIETQKEKEKEKEKEEPERQHHRREREPQDAQDNGGLAGFVKKKKRLPFHKLEVVPKLVADLNEERNAAQKAAEDCDSSSLNGKIVADEAGKNGRTPLGVPDPPPNRKDEEMKAIDAVDTDDNMSVDPKVLSKGIKVAEEAQKALNRIVHKIKVLCSEQSCPMQA